MPGTLGTSIRVVVNGDSHEIPVGTTVAELVVRLGLGGKPVAVEMNRQVVPKARHPDTTLVEGDRLELVTFVGGG